MPEDIISQGLGEERDRLGAVENMLVEGDKVSPEEVNYGPAPEGSPRYLWGTVRHFEIPGNEPLYLYDCFWRGAGHRPVRYL
jgi:hypothetical protein